MSKDYEMQRTCHVICQSHIDMAWLWRWEETIGFIRDTFEAEIDLLEKHPDYTFCQSQLLAYEVAQERFPELFEKIRKYVREGRWEVVGGELVESDHLIPSGESLVRQLVYGQLYARRELGTQATVGWSPDSFGHSGNLPQILAKCGIDNFVYKRPMVGEQPVPQTPFWWQGIDGTRVLAYRTTNKGWDFVNPIPRELAQKHNLRQTWGYSGTGDRGGVRPYKKLGEDEHGRHIYSTPGRYFQAVRAETKGLPVFAGELNYTYEGCYSTHADAKIANRRAEGLLYLSESLAAAAWLEGIPYPQDQLHEAWRILAFHQFHDILPGTSIPEVYEDAHREYERLEEIVRDVMQSSSKAFIGDRNSSFVCVYNPLPHERWAQVQLDACDFDAAEDTVTGRTYRLRTEGERASFLAQSLPPCSFRVFKLKKLEKRSEHSSDLVLDNGILQVSVNAKSGWIDSIVDLRSGRQVLASPGGNVLTLWREDSFENPNAAEWNAWDIGVSDKSEPAILKSAPMRVDDQVGMQSIQCEHEWGTSSFTSTICLPESADFIHIELDCNWHETLVMLRAEFALDLWSEAEAWHEIPYGAVRRDTNGAEVPCYRWVDLSDSLYGAALINDSRCGHSIKGNTIRVTLLRCATNPDPVSDRGRYTFRYRFYAHEGDWRNAEVINRAAELNVPVALFDGDIEKQSALPVLPDQRVALGACKVAEDGRSLMLRLHEPHGRHARARIKLNKRFTCAIEANLLEDAQASIEIINGSIELDFSPFEIKTVLVM